MILVREWKRDRVGSAAAVAAIHAGLLYLLLAGLGFDASAPLPDALKLFQVSEAPPPPAEPPPPERVRESHKARPKDPEGAAAPPNLKNTPTEIVVPPPEIELKLPPPIPAAPVAGQGSAAAAGAAPVPGPGTGRGGQGTGLGSGLFGSGTGGGGGGLGRATRARFLSGSIGPDDYPPAAVSARATGTVHLRFVVAPTGRVSSCRVTRSSGNSALDAETCRLIVRRFRYRPARDSSGRPVPETILGEHDWELGPEPPPTWVEPVEEE